MSNQKNTNKKLSTKLCTYIDDRNIDNDICDKIKWLIEQGADVNFQDPNFDGNTPMLIAVANNDVKCVEFILGLEVDFETKNNDGETALDLAKKNENSEILRIFQSILSPYFLSINPECILEVNDVEDFSTSEIKTKKKIVRTKNDQSLQEICKIFDSTEFREFVSKSPGLFALDLKVNGCTADMILKAKIAKFLDPERSWVIQVKCGENVQKIFYKEPKKLPTVINKMENSNLDEFTYSNLLKNEFTFQNLMQGFFLNLFGSFYGDIFSTKIEKKNLVYYELITAVENDGLCLRFLFLFSDLSPEMENNEPPAKKIKLMRKTDNCLNFLNRLKVLLNAIEMNDIKFVRKQMKSGITGNRAFSDVAWELKHFGILQELLEADSPFPKNFDHSLNSCFNVHINAVNSFHKDVESGLMEKVELFVSENPKIKFAYDSTNKSVLTVALESKQLEIYAFFRARGFSHGIDENFTENLKTLTDEEKKIIKEKNSKYFKSSDNSHLFYILSKIRISFNPGNYEKDFEIVRKILEELNEIEEIRPILKAVEHVDLKIVFDFKQRGINEMIPEKSENEIGCCFFDIGEVYIGAKENGNRHGTLAHELSHYVMNLIYRNKGKPFFPTDSEQEFKYNKVIRKLEKYFLRNQHRTDPIFHDIFKCYEKMLWQYELIVCVPEILATYRNNPKIIREIKSYAGGLFDFFYESTLKDVENVSFLIQPKAAIRELNDLLGTLHEVWNSKIYFVNSEFDINSALNLRIIASEAPTISMVMILEAFHELYKEACDCHVIFVKIGALNSEVLKVIRNAMNSSVKPYLVVNAMKSTESQRKMLQTSLSEFKLKERIILVSKIDESEELQELFEEDPEFLTHSWEDFDDRTHKFLIDQNLNFQGHAVKLSDIISISSEALLTIELQNFFEENSMEIGKPLNSNDDFIIPRNFLLRYSTGVGSKRNSDYSRGKLTKEKESNRSNKTWARGKYEAEKFEKEIDGENFSLKDQTKKNWTQKTFEELLKESEKHKKFLISDTSGTGKTVMLKEIGLKLKSKHPTRWVDFIDLKQHVESFKELSREEPISFRDFILKVFYRHASCFNQATFKELYEKGRTTLLFDSFDEISPNFKEMIIEFIKSFQIKAGNQLWVTTRSHLEDELEKVMDPRIVKLDFLSKEEQIKFLMKSWNKNKSETNQQRLQNKAENLIGQLEILTLTEAGFVGFPILIKMIAEIYNEEDYQQIETLSFFKIYQKFTGKLFWSWRERGEVSKMEQNELDMQAGCLNVMKIHQKYAIDHIFGDEFKDFEEETDDSWTNEMISRVGIIIEDDKSCKFLHETFAEYFVAQYLIDHMHKKSKHEKIFDIFLKVIIEKDFQIIRSFLEDSLKEKSMDKLKQDNIETFSDKLRCTIEDEILGCIEILYHLVREGQINLFDFFNFKKFKKSTLSELLLRKFGGENLFAHAVLSLKPMMSRLFDCFQSQSSENEAMQVVFDMFKEKNNNGDNAIHNFFSFSESAEVFDDLCSVLRKIATTEEIKDLILEKDCFSRNILGCFAINLETKLRLQKIWTFLKSFLDTSKLFELLIAKDSSNEQDALHLALTEGNEEFAKDLFEIIKEDLSDEQRRILFESRDRFGSNILHSACSCKNFSLIFELLRNCLTDADMKIMIQMKDNVNANIISIAALNPVQKIFTQLLECIQNLFNEIQVREIVFGMIKEKDDDDEINAILRLFEYGESEEAFDDFCSVLRRVASTGEIKNFILEKDKLSINILGYFASNFMTSLRLSKIWTFLKSILDSSELLNLLTEKDNSDERDAFHLALTEGNVEYAIDFFEIIENDISDKQRKNLLKSEDKFGSNILHSACFCKKFLMIFDRLRNYFNDAEMKIMIQKRDEENANITFFAAVSSVENIFSQLFDCFQTMYGENKAKEIIFEMFKEKNIHGDGAIFKFFEFGKSEEVFDDLCLLLRRLASPEQIKNLILEKGQYSRNILGYFAFNSDTSLKFSKIWTFLKSFLSPFELYNLLNEKNENSNVLHLVLTEENESFVEDLFEIIKEDLSDEQRRKLLRSEDKFGSNILHLACSCKNFSMIFDFLRNCLTDAEMKILIQKRDEENANLVSYAIESSVQDIFSQLFDCFQNLYSENETKEIFFDMVKEKNEDGEDAILKFFAFGKSEEIFDNLCLLLRKIASTDQIKNLFLEKDQSSRNILGFLALNLETTLKFSKIWNFLKSFLDSSELFNLLVEKESDTESHALHLALTEGNEEFAKDFTKIIMEDLSDEQKMILFECENKIGSILYSACYCKNFSKIFEYMKNCLTDAEMKALIQKRNDKNCNILLGAAESPIKKIFSNLFFCFQSQYNEFESRKIFFEMLKEKDDYGNNVIFMFFRFSKSEEVFDDLCSVLREVASAEQIKSLFLEKDQFSMNILGRFAFNTKTKIGLPKIRNFLNSSLDSSEFYNLIIEKNGENEDNALHLAISFGNKNFIKDLFEIIEASFTDEQRNLLIHSQDKHGNNVLHSASACETEIFETVVDCLRTFLSVEELKKMFWKKNNDGFIPLQQLACEGTLEKLKEICKVLNKVLNENEFKKMLVSKTTKQQNILHISVADKKNLGFIKAFLKTLKDTLGKSSKEIGILIREVDLDGKTPLMLAEENENKNIVTLLQKHLSLIKK